MKIFKTEIEIKKDIKRDVCFVKKYPCFLSFVLRRFYKDY